MNTIKELLNAHIIGDAMSDLPLLDRLHDYIVDESNDIDDRCRALHKFDQVMGEAGDEEPTASDVIEYGKVVL